MPLKCKRTRSSIRARTRSCLLAVLVDAVAGDHAQSPPQGRRSQADQAVQAVRERVRLGAVVLSPLEGDVKPILLPGQVEERDQPMVEQVEPVAERILLGGPELALDLVEQLGIVPREHAAGTGQSHEGLDHHRDRQAARRPAGSRRSSWAGSSARSAPGIGPPRRGAARPGRPGLAPVPCAGAGERPGRSRSCSSPRRAAARANGDARASAGPRAGEQRASAARAQPAGRSAAADRAAAASDCRLPAAPRPDARQPVRRRLRPRLGRSAPDRPRSSATAEPLLRFRGRLVAGAAAGSPRSVVGPPPSPAMSSAALRLAWSWRPTA